MTNQAISIRKRPLWARAATVTLLSILLAPLLHADPRVAELDRYDAQLQKMIDYHRATHLPGAPLPPEILDMQAKIRQQRAALGAAGNTAGRLNIPTQGLSRSDQSLVQGVQLVGDIFNTFVQEHQNQQARREAEEAQREEQERLASQRAALEQSQRELAELMRAQSELQARREQEVMLARDRAAFSGDDWEAQLPSLRALAQQDPARYAGLLRDKEAEYERRPPRPLFSTPLSSFGSAAPGGAGGQTMDSFSRLPARVSTRAAWEGINPSGSSAEFQTRNLRTAGSSLRDIRYGVLNDSLRQADQMGFGEVMGSWMNYAESAADNVVTRRWHLPDVRNAKDKLLDAWSRFLDEGIIKDIKSF